MAFRSGIKFELDHHVLDQAIPHLTSEFQTVKEIAKSAGVHRSRLGQALAGAAIMNMVERQTVDARGSMLLGVRYRRKAD